MDEKSCSFCGIPANLHLVTLRLTLVALRRIFLPCKDLANNTESIHKITNLCICEEKRTLLPFQANVTSFLFQDGT